ncbi:MAG: bifunctional 4-hydroxy-3-methylbut-2-enyl diphosphate reductase/30S ribosomal protein S1, partial [Clostridiaceae bacterium]|nr:bifunctional 4-hydroxy-3-methylbut-2-enyl diphosphate reductase/30S ribosomal protein S1 [Clostridiaceae bacterium]
FGVSRAVKMAEEIVQKEDIKYSYGNVIHNQQVINELREQGLITVNDICEIPDGSAVLVRAHGVSSTFYDAAKEKKLKLYDATCPYVGNIHKRVQMMYEEGYKIIIVGSSMHPEVIGINGYCNNSAIILEDESELEKIEPDDKNKYCCVAQTTLIKEKYEKITSELKKKFTLLEVFDTICSATSLRQSQAVKLASNVDIMIVIGDPTSSNTRKLYEVCKEKCTRTYLVSSAMQAEDIDINYKEMVGITAGASTPDRIVREVKETMEDNAKKGTQNTFEEMLEDSLVTLRNGQVVTGKVIGVNDKEVYLDIGFKIDGTISVEEFPVGKDGRQVAVGDTVEAIVTRVSDRDGIVYLSKKKIDEKRKYEDIKDAFTTGDAIKGTVKEATSGGLILDINGLDAFMPISHISTQFQRNLQKFIGRKLKVRVIECDRRKRKLIVSRKVLIEEENERMEKEVWSKLVVGDVVKGTVKSFSNFGAFIDLGGIDGLAHISELSWGKINHPEDVLELGQEVDVIIKDIDKDKRKVSLAYRKEEDDPWYMAEEKFAPNTIITGKVVRILPFGVFVEIAKDIDALVHISQISNKRLKSASDVLEEGQMVDVAIIDVDIENKKINASIKAVQPLDPLPTQEEIDRENQREERRQQSIKERTEKFTRRVENAETAPTRDHEPRQSRKQREELPVSHEEVLSNKIGSLLADFKFDEETASEAPKKEKK